MRRVFRVFRMFEMFVSSAHDAPVEKNANSQEMEVGLFNRLAGAAARERLLFRQVNSAPPAQSDFSDFTENDKIAEKFSCMTGFETLP
jgi:hypothetical protein